MQKRSSSFKHLFRIATVFVPSLLAWILALDKPHRDELTMAVTWALAPLWLVLSTALALRIAVVLFERRRIARQNRAPILAHIDVLTSSGTALAWSSAAAIMGAVWFGWASLAVVGMLGTALFDLVVLFAFVTLRRGGDLVRSGGSITRRFSSNVTEGDDVTEEIILSGIHIPIGYRLFVAGRLGPRWATSRHVLETSESGAEIILESEVGPALRGDHEAELLEVWLEDTFGLCRSMVAHVGPATLTVLPRLRAIDKTKPLVDHGFGARVSRPTKRLPTEGIFHLREYQPGDDVRRIHWVRSLTKGGGGTKGASGANGTTKGLNAADLIVRLPDEVPPDRPRVRLVLDTYFPEAFALTCDAPSDMLDTMVAVWLGAAHALAQAGVRVTLVTPMALQTGSGSGRMAAKRHELSLRAPSPALHLGAKAAWQGQMQVNELLTDEATFVVASAVRIVPPTNPNIRWILVSPPPSDEPAWPQRKVCFELPMGHTENRSGHRRRVINAIVQKRAHHERAMAAMQTNVALPPPGSFAALPVGMGIQLRAIS